MIIELDLKIVKINFKIRPLLTTINNRLSELYNVK